MDLYVENLTHAVVVNLTGDFNMHQVPVFKENIAGIFSHPQENIVINMLNVQSIDSAGIGQLVSLLSTANSRKKKFYLMNLTGHVLEVFQTVKLDKFFKILSERDVLLKMK
jgi:anti-anti-sigma factor